MINTKSIIRELIYSDLYRLKGKKSLLLLAKTILSNRVFRRLCYYRIISNCNNHIVTSLFRMLNYFLKSRVLVELPKTVRIGKGILLIHPYCITFNSKSIIGDNITILKGATIGNTKSGNEGAPTIGNNVYIGLNATVVGKITIGDNVLIAPNSFVNFDVPSDSVVIGNPGVIHHKVNASAPYTTNPV